MVQFATTSVLILGLCLNGPSMNSYQMCTVRVKWPNYAMIYRKVKFFLEEALVFYFPVQSILREDSLPSSESKQHDLVESGTRVQPYQERDQRREIQVAGVDRTEHGRVA